MKKNNKDYIYLAGGLFNGGSTIFNANLCDGLEKRGYNCYLPQRDGFEVVKFVDFLAHVESLHLSKETVQKISHYVPYFLDLGVFLSHAIGFVGNLDDPLDSGTMVEFSYAHTWNLPVVGIRTDVRTPFGDAGSAFAINPFPVAQCDIFLKNAIPVGGLSDAMSTFNKLVEKVDECLKSIIPLKKNQMQSTDNPVIANIIKGAHFLFDGVSDVHSPDGMKEIAQRYIDNEKFFDSITPKVVLN